MLHDLLLKQTAAEKETKIQWNDVRNLHYKEAMFIVTVCHCNFYINSYFAAIKLCEPLCGALL